MKLLNEGGWDRALRLLAGAALCYAAWQFWPATAAVIIGALGVVALATGVIGWCPAYTILHWSTRQRPALDEKR